MNTLQAILAALPELSGAQSGERALPLGAWEAAVGPRIAARARPIRIERGVLSVRAATSAWASELSLLADDIVQRLAAHGVMVSGLRFSVGPLGDVRTAKRRPKRRVAVRLPPELQEALARVEDPVLRRALADAASHTLERPPAPKGRDRT